LKRAQGAAVHREKQTSPPRQRHLFSGGAGLRPNTPVPQKRSSRRAETGCYTAEDLASLAEYAPDAYRQLIAGETSRRRLEWAGLVAQISGHLCGLAALLMLCAVSWHAIDRGASTQGASIICTGAVSIVALFVSGKMSDGRSRNGPRAKEAKRQPADR
jgi:hypothetical protein